jgi:hypothetical protein
MKIFEWSPLNSAALLLEGEEREAVLGDLAEAGESATQQLLGILGLVVRRQSMLWKNWRPWLATFGLAFPGSLLLMGVSVSIGCSYQWLTGLTLSDKSLLPDHPGFLLLLCHILLLAAWSWTSGFVVGSLSRRTLWVSAVACFSPCLFCLTRFRTPSLPRLCLFLFVLPALWGVFQGSRLKRIQLRPAILLAIAVTVLMIAAWSNHGMWVFNWALIWPVWHMVASAWKPTEGKGQEWNGE